MTSHTVQTAMRMRPFGGWAKRILMRAVGGLLVNLAIHCIAPVPALAEGALPDPARDFHGPYLAVEAGGQNIFSGADFGGRDELTRKTRFALDFSGGWRYQFANGIVVGLELRYGLIDGNLDRLDTLTATTFSHRNRNQWGYGAQLGYALGQARRTLVFAYILQIERDFDVTIDNEFGSFRQRDEQGLLRIGVGLEIRIRRNLHLVGRLGTTAADFGGRPKNIDPDGRIEVSGGLLVQF